MKSANPFDDEHHVNTITLILPSAETEQPSCNSSIRLNPLCTCSRSLGFGVGIHVASREKLTVFQFASREKLEVVQLASQTKFDVVRRRKVPLKNVDI